MNNYIIIKRVSDTFEWDFVGLPFKCQQSNLYKKALQIIKQYGAIKENCLIISKNDLRFFNGLLIKSTKVKYK